MGLPEFAPRRTPEELARWTRIRVGMGDPRFSMHTVAGAFGVPIVTVPHLAKAGTLQLFRGKVSILVLEARSERRRFTAAHELAHYLLAAEEEVPVRVQIDNDAAERYCDEYASHLLLPREWLSRSIPRVDAGLTDALDVARRAECSLPAVVVALNQRAGWRRRLLRWRLSENRWTLAGINGPRSKVLARTPDVDVLRDASSSPTRSRIDIATEFGRRSFDVEIVRRGSTVFGLLADDPDDLLWQQIYPKVARDAPQRWLKRGMAQGKARAVPPGHDSLRAFKESY